MSKIKLYVLPASHPCVAVEAALELKSIPFDRIDLLPLTQLAVGPLRYGGNTVPGIRPTPKCWRPSAGATRSCSPSRDGSCRGRSCASRL